MISLIQAELNNDYDEYYHEVRYNKYMRSKSLLKTNPYLKDPKKRQQIIETVTVSSSSIEGVHAAAEQAIKNVAKNKTAFSAAHACVLSKKERT